MLWFFWKQIHQGETQFRITRSKIVFNCTSWQMKLSTLIFCRILLGTGKVEEQWVDVMQSSSVFPAYCSCTQGSPSASLDRHCINSWDSTNYSLKSSFKTFMVLLHSVMAPSHALRLWFEPIDSAESPGIYLSLTWIHLSLDMGRKCPSKDPEVYRQLILHMHPLPT